MTNTKTTKRALFASVIALLLCIVMLVGVTFAWFSDSASTSVNTIQAGKLKIDLVDEAHKSVVGQTIDFIKAEGAPEGEAILWEPGCTYELPKLYVENKGNLAFKYKVVITGINGDAELNDVIDWTIDYGFGEGNPEGHMAGNSQYSEPITISGHMQEEAGNHYQGMTITGVTITVIATQDTVEYDSFNNTYDANADGTPDNPQYVNVNTNEQLKDAVKDAEVGDVIVLNSGEYKFDEKVETNGTFAVKEGANVAIDLNGNALDITKSVNADEVKVNAPTVENKGNLTIENGTILNENVTAGNTNVAAVKNVEGTLTLKNCVIKNVAPTGGGAYSVVVEGGKVVLEDCNVTGGRGGISVSGEGAIEMKGGSVTAGYYYPLYIMGTGVSTFDDVDFLQNGTKAKAMTYQDNFTGKVTFTKCTFKSVKTGAKFDINGNTTGFIFEGNNTFTNVTNPIA